MTEWLGLPPDWSTTGAEIDRLLGIVHWMMLVLFVLGVSFLLVALVRFRSGSGARRGGSPPKRWIFALVALIAVAELSLMAFVEVPIFARLRDLPEPEDATVVRAIGEQFAWSFHYPGEDGVFGETFPELIDGTNPVGMDYDDPASEDDVVTINQLHVPTGKPVLIYLSSKDVIHGFNIPYLRVKQDAIPGHVIPVWFEAKEEGRTEIACAQLCGLGHFRMRAFLTIEDPEEFQAWYDEELLYQ